MGVDKAEIAAALVEPAIAVIRYLWHRAHGDDTKPDEAALREQAVQAAHALVTRAELDMQRIAAAEGMQVATIDLAAGALTLMTAIKLAASTPSLTDQLLDGADVQQVPDASKPE
jgi:hypothetical protein